MRHGYLPLLFPAFLALCAPSARAADPMPVAPVIACSALAKSDLGAAVGARTTIASATEVHEGPKGYCKVEGVVAPAVRFEVRLPLAGWTQRYVQTGCGGLCGHLDIHLEKADTCTPALKGEFALASTDMGHEGGMDGAWGREDYQTRVDFAYRGVHVTTLAAKALIARYYGQKARYSYFIGCSDGGREALMEAQRYPDDFNGIMAGAPAMNFTTQNSFYHGWNAVTNSDAAGHPILTADRLPLLHRTVLEQCDAADGVRDGLVSDPIHCHPDLAKVTCAAGQKGDTCLTPEQVKVALEIYRGAHDAAGRGLVIGGPMPGSELGWAGVYVPPPGQQGTMSAMISEGTIRNLDYDPNPPANFMLRDFRFDAANFAATTRLHALYDSTDTDLSRFQKAGGRLILWHGLADPHIAPMNTVAYFEGMKGVMGGATVDGFARLYLFPGGGHCGGGEGPFDFDLVSAMLAWVEGQHAPGALLAKHSAGGDGPPAGLPPLGKLPPGGPPPGMPPGGPPPGMLPPGGPPPGMGPPGMGPPGAPAGAVAKVDRTRPVYPYPQVARYVGHGSIDDAANFDAAPGAPWPVNDAWYGAQFFRTHEHLWCSGKGAHFECTERP
jgi:feruloyl esterase